MLQETLGGYTTLASEKKDIRMNTRRARYALLPVWRYIYKYRDKEYPFYVNGQTFPEFLFHHFHRLLHSYLKGQNQLRLIFPSYPFVYDNVAFAVFAFTGGMITMRIVLT